MASSRQVANLLFGWPGRVGRVGRIGRVGRVDRVGRVGYIGRVGRDDRCTRSWTCTVRCPLRVPVVAMVEMDLVCEMRTDLYVVPSCVDCTPWVAHVV